GGLWVVTCEFRSTKFRFDAAAFQALVATWGAACQSRRAFPADFEDPRAMNVLRLLSPIVAMLMLAACESAPPRPNFPDIHITEGAPIRLAVGGIDIRVGYKPSFQRPNVEPLYPIPPAHALENWAHDRLVAAGGNARAVFIISDASVTETELKKKEEGITGAFTKEPAQRYDATVEVTLSIVDERGVRVR